MFLDLVWNTLPIVCIPLSCSPPNYMHSSPMLASPWHAFLSHARLSMTCIPLSCSPPHDMHPFSCSPPHEMQFFLMLSFAWHSFLSLQCVFHFHAPASLICIPFSCSRSVTLIICLHFPGGKCCQKQRQLFTPGCGLRSPGLRPAITVINYIPD